jgi:hypothetical protein
MKIRHLQTRFILAGVLLVMTTIVSGIWSAWTFARLTAVAGKTLGASQQTIDLTAILADAGPGLAYFLFGNFFCEHRLFAATMLRAKCI